MFSPFMRSHATAKIYFQLSFHSEFNRPYKQILNEVVYWSPFVYRTPSTRKIKKRLQVHPVFYYVCVKPYMRSSIDFRLKCERF